MSDSLRSLAQHCLLDSVIYGPMLTPEQRKESARQKAELLAKKAKARMEYEALMNLPDETPERSIKASPGPSETPTQ